MPKNDIEQYEDDKSAFMEMSKALRPDLFFPETWSDEQKATVSEMVRPAKTRTMMFASIPMICRAKDCVFAKLCPLQQKGIAPKGSSCPIEMALAQQCMQEYMEELGVDPNNLVEVSIVRDIVDQEIQTQRKTWLLSLEEMIQENPIGVNDKGEVIFRKELHLAVDLEDRLHRRKKDLRNQLLATREARAKAGQGTIDTAQSIANVLEDLRGLEIAKEKALRKRLGIEEFDDYIEAETVEEE